MDIKSQWDEALKHTEVIRARLEDLPTHETAALPYVFLAESSVNQGDTVVRRGQVLVDRASLILPTARFENFEFEEDFQVSYDAVLNFLLVRGVRFPSMRYRHERSALDLREGSLQDAITHYRQQFEQREDIATGLVIGPEAAWQFSVLILVGSSMIRSAEGDLRRLFDTWKKRRPDAP